VNQSPSEPPQPKHDPLAALRQPRFLLYLLSRTFSGIGQAMLQAILAWHVYDITGNPLSLGFLGLARFIPALGISMVGGAAADAYNRRNIILIAQTVPLACGAVLAFSTLNDWVSPALIYGLVLLIGLASSFEGPARAALLPAIVRPETFPNAVTVASTLQTLGMVSGPLLGGAVISAAGFDMAYTVYSCLLVVAFLTMSMLRYEQSTDGPRRTVNLTVIKEGLHYVRTHQVPLGAMTLDMFAVLFAGAKGLLPVFAKDILHTDALGYTMLLASLEIGALMMSLILVMRPPIYHSGKALVYTVVIFGLLSVAFGLSRNLYLSIGLYMLIGAADQISVVMRTVLIQLTTPDELRGRVSSVNMVFIQASNQLGSAYSGFLAAATSAPFAVVMGGFVAASVAVMVGLRLKELFNYTTPRAISQSAPGAVPPATTEGVAGGAGGSG